MIFIYTKDFAFEKWDANNDEQIDMTEFDNFMMPIMEMRRNQKADQIFEPHDTVKALITDSVNIGCMTHIFPNSTLDHSYTI